MFDRSWWARQSSRDIAIATTLPCSQGAERDAHLSPEILSEIPGHVMVPRTFRMCLAQLNLSGHTLADKSSDVSAR